MLKGIASLVLGLAAASWAAGAAEPLNIRQGWVTLNNTLEVLAFDKPDILPHYGKSYRVTQTRFSGTSAEVTALATGEIDLCTIAYSSFGAAILNARLDDIRVVADGFQDGYADYLSTPYLVLNDSGIRTIEDLKGKAIAVNVIGGAVDIGARANLKAHGLEHGRDYTIVEAPFPAMGSMLQQHKLDVIAGAPPFMLDPNLVAVSHPLFHMKDEMGPSQMIAIVARTGFLEKNRAALDDFFADMVRGVHWLLDPRNRPQVIAFVAQETKDAPASFAGYYLTKDDFYHQPDGIPNIAAFQRNIDTQRKLGFLKDGIDVAKFSDLSFIERAAAAVAADERR